jgi:hypothetical protein
MISEGSNGGLIEVLTMHFVGGSEENHEYIFIKIAGIPVKNRAQDIRSQVMALPQHHSVKEN